VHRCCAARVSDTRVLLQTWRLAKAMALALWVVGCTYVRSTPSYAYAANVASFSAGNLVLMQRCVALLARRLRPRGVADVLRVSDRRAAARTRPSKRCTGSNRHCMGTNCAFLIRPMPCRYHPRTFLASVLRCLC
jgi:hypothetical protein